MKYIVAVSGGVDSVVLLDMMSKVDDHELIVAHFDHGIRSDSHEDAAFVGELAKKYGHLYFTKRESLGESASEELARNRRYEYLHSLAKAHDAKIVTAHHLDDLIETIAINMTRGTGWRGLAVFESEVVRPLVDIPKEELVKYARSNGLVWREDSTNSSDAYLRNRLRQHTQSISIEKKRELRALHATQRALRIQIRNEIVKLIGNGPDYSRYLFTHMPPKAAIECLRLITDRRLTRPQLERLLHAIKTARPGSRFEAGVGITAQFNTRYFRF